MEPPQMVADDDLTLVERSQDDLLSAACAISHYEASRLLNIRQTGHINGVPSREYFRRLFTFSKARLLRYITSHPGLADRLLWKSYDNRGSPNAYMEAAQGGVFGVGWFDGARSQVRLHHRIEDAATDFVLMSWGLARD